MLVHCPLLFGEEKKIWKADVRIPQENQTTKSRSAFHKEWEFAFEDFRKSLIQKYSLPFPYFESPEIDNNNNDNNNDNNNNNNNNENEKKYQYIELSGSKLGQSYLNDSNRDILTFKKLSLVYFDTDVEETVTLEADTLSEFLSQKKKVLTVKYDTEVKIERKLIIVEKPVVIEQQQQTAPDATTTTSTTTSTTFLEVEDSKLSSHVNTQEELSLTPPPIPSFPPPPIPVISPEESLSLTSTISSPPPIPVDLPPPPSPPAPRSRSPSPIPINIIEKEVSSKWRLGIKGESETPCLRSKLITINGIRMRGLDRNHILAILKQRLRPLFLEFETDKIEIDGEFKAEDNLTLNGQTIHEQIDQTTAPQTITTTTTTTPSTAINSNSNSTRDTSHISASTFLAKYSHPSAKGLRKQVSKVLVNYQECDWNQVISSGTGSPQLFVTSLYRSIESELENLGLFDSTTPQGGGIPRMQDSHWMDVRAHIETLIFNSIFDHTWALAPKLEYCNLIDPENPNKIHNLIYPREIIVPLQVKLAYLRFLTLKDLGINLPDNISSPGVYYPSIHSIIHKNFAVTLPEEWRFALKELSRACEMKSPLKIMQKLKAAVTLATHALEGLLSHPQTYLSSSTSSASTTNENNNNHNDDDDEIKSTITYQ